MEPIYIASVIVLIAIIILYLYRPRYIGIRVHPVGFGKILTREANCAIENIRRDMCKIAPSLGQIQASLAQIPDENCDIRVVQAQFDALRIPFDDRGKVMQLVKSLCVVAPDGRLMVDKKAVGDALADTIRTLC